MKKGGERWKCEQQPGGPENFPYAVMSGDEVISWAKTQEDAEFIARARDVVPRLVDEITLLMSGVDNIRNFVRNLDEDLHALEAEMKRRL